MVDVTQQVEQAIYDCLAGKILYESVLVPVKAGFSLAEGLSTHHIIIDNVTDSPDDTLNNYTSKVNVTLQVVSLPNGYSHKPVNAIASFVRSYLQPAFGAVGLTAPTGMQFHNLRVSSPNGYIEEWQDGQAIIRKILSIELNVNHS